MWYTDQKSRGGLCLCQEDGGDSLCGNYACTRAITKLPEDTGYDSLWEVIAEDDVHGNCEQRLAEKLGFEDFGELQEKAEKMRQRGTA